MKRATAVLLGIIFSFLGSKALAHPGSGIVVDKQGNVYFVDTGSGVWKLTQDSTLARLSGPAYHWIAIDPDGRFNNVTLPHFSSGGATVTRIGTNPSILLSSDFPIAVGREGALFYPWIRDGNRLQVFRLDTSGTTTIFATLPPTTENKPPRWVNGAAVGSDGSFYYTEDRSVRKISLRGEVTTIAANLPVSGCNSVPGIGPEFGPYLRGIDVDSQGSVYVAATGCGAVLKITTDKKVTTVLRCASPWSPTGVAVYGEHLYVLEYLHTVGDDRREWVPRVRKVTSDGRIITVAAINR